MDPEGERAMTSTASQPASGYYRTNPWIWLCRAVLGASQRLWPSLAVHIAGRLFATPFPPKWLRRRKAWQGDWRIERWPFEGSSVTLYARAAAAHAPVVLLVHGWGGHARQMLPLAEATSQAGLRPVILEMPAHGRSGGAVSNLPQFARAIEYVCARLHRDGQELRAVVAHSLGANGAAYAASRGPVAQRLVLIAPPASAREYTRLFAAVLGLSERTRARMQLRLEAAEGILMAQFEPAAVGARIAAPTLVVHDRGDNINRFADGQAFADAIPGAALLPTEGLGHRRLLKDPQVLQAVTDFLR